MINTEKIPHTLRFYPSKREPKGLISVPHSGEVIPDEFREFLIDDTQKLMQDVDFRVHELIDIPRLQENGVAVLYSEIIRVAVDLNREKSKSCLNWKSNSKGFKIVQKEPPEDVREHLIEKYYSPYYEMIKTAISELRRKNKTPSFIDLHSMPTMAEAYHLKINPHQEKIRPNFCLSDRKGITCEESYIKYIGSLLEKTSRSVKYNDPYVGGNITGHVHDTFNPINNIQVEISRSIYMNEETKELKTKEFESLKQDLTDAFIRHFNYFYKSNQS